MKNALLGSILLGFSLTAVAQPKLVRDINSGSSSSAPSWTTLYKNKLLYFATDGVTGIELYVTDSTSRLQYDINPGAADGGMISTYAKMAVVGNNVYFPADNGSTGFELYMWNGVDSVAPSLVTDINTGSLSSNINEIVAVDGKLYFNASTTTYGDELWSYNPATSYLQRLTDLYPGTTGSTPRNLTAYNGKLYFSATSNTLGRELYAYDPVSNTTTLVADILTGTGGSDPQGLMVANNKLWFSAMIFTYGRELYNYDGKNVSRLTNVDNAAGDGVVGVMNMGDQQLFWFKNMVYFLGDAGTGNAQLYSFNPMNGVASTVFLINPSGNAEARNFTVYGNKMYFSADDGTHGSELWAYDGVTIPYMVADIDSLIGSFPSNFQRYSNRLYFTAFNSLTGAEMYYISDSAVTGIQNARFEGSVKLYPNPTTGIANVQLTLSKAQKLSYVVTDMTGRVVVKKDLTEYAAGENNLSVNLLQYAAGQYIFRACDESGAVMVSSRLTKQ